MSGPAEGHPVAMTTPSNPDNDTDDDATHHGEDEQAASGRTPDTPEGDD